MSVTQVNDAPAEDPNNVAGLPYLRRRSTPFLLTVRSTWQQNRESRLFHATKLALEWLLQIHHGTN